MAPPTGPQAAPMSDPTEQEGLKAQAMQGVQLAIKLLESSLLPFGTQSPEGKKILSTINALTKLAGGAGEGPDLGQAEVKLLAAKAGPQGAGGPAPPAPGPGGPGGPGGGPPGMPPGMPPGGMPMGGPMPRGL